MKNFALLPIMAHRRHHVRFDTRSLFELVKPLKLYDGNVNEFHADADNQWRRFFDFRKLEVGAKTFDNSFTTDGVAMSFNMWNPRKARKRSKFDPVPNAETDEPVPNLANIRTDYEAQKYVKRIGLDPGKCLVFGGVSIREGSDENTEIKLKNS